MNIDWYTKGVLTVIAAALLGIVMQNYVSEAWAATQAVRVKGGKVNCYVTNAEEIGREVARQSD
jgi:hypothetical protein